MGKFLMVETKCVAVQIAERLKLIDHHRKHQVGWKKLYLPACEVYGGHTGRHVKRVHIIPIEAYFHIPDVMTVSSKQRCEYDNLRYVVMICMDFSLHTYLI